MDAFSFTLILTTAIFGSNHNSGSSISTTQVTGFATYDECMDAGRDARIPADRKYFETDKVYSCVKVKV